MRESASIYKGAVFLVDDDVAVQRGVAALLAAADYAAMAFSSAEEFLSRLPALDLSNAALLVDVCMPGIQGLELQARLNRDRVALPVIVMTAHGDVAMAVRAMRNGATDFLQKPFTIDEIVSALDRALASRSLAAPATGAPGAEIATLHQSLTPREREILGKIVVGGTSKEIARDLSISPRTVEVHRQNIMTKMHAENLAALVRMAVRLGVGEDIDR